MEQDGASPVRRTIAESQRSSPPLFFAAEDLNAFARVFHVSRGPLQGMAVT